MMRMMVHQSPAPTYFSQKIPKGHDWLRHYSYFLNSIAEKSLCFGPGILQDDGSFSLKICNDLFGGFPVGFLD